MTGLITVRNGGEGCYEEKKSRFLAAVYSVESDEQAASVYRGGAKKNIGMQDITVMHLS